MSAAIRCSYQREISMPKHSKVGKVMREYKKGSLHSGSKSGPKVTNPKQAKAIALSEARKAGEKVGKPKRGHKSRAKRLSGKAM